MNTWSFDPLTYQVGWRSFGVDQPHYPFQYRPTAEDMVEYERECAKAAQQFQSQLDDDLYWAFVTMVNPEARVYACGFTGPGDAEKVRAYVAVRGPHAIVVRQDPGPDHRCGGTVHVSRIPSGRCGDGVVRALPSVDPGRRSRIDVDRDDFERDTEDEFDSPASWLHSSSSQSTPKQELEQVLNLPRIGVGRVEVYSGATIGERDTGGVRDVRWVDVADDGRYLFAASPRTVSLLPGRDDAFATVVQKLVTGAIEENRSELAL